MQCFNVDGSAGRLGSVQNGIGHIHPHQEVPAISVEGAVRLVTVLRITAARPLSGDCRVATGAIVLLAGSPVSGTAEALDADDDGVIGAAFFAESPIFEKVLVTFDGSEFVVELGQKLIQSEGGFYIHIRAGVRMEHYEASGIPAVSPPYTLTKARPAGTGNTPSPW